MTPTINNNPYMQNSYMQYQQPIYQQQQNPYMDRLQNLQQFQQTLQQPQPQQPNFLNGKIVDSIDVVKATDIPMDGNLYYFPKADGTEIYAKSWLANGTTRILTFKPVLDGDMSILSNESEKSNLDLLGTLTDTFMKRFDGIESRFDELEKSWNNSSTKSTNSSTKSIKSSTKKEGEE